MVSPKSQTLQHLSLRQTKTDADLQEFFSQTQRPGTRVSHQKLPPDETLPAATRSWE